MNRQRWLCPFCKAAIVETDSLFYDIAAVEETLRTHLLERHPIRWRLSRKFRKAIAHGRLAS